MFGLGKVGHPKVGLGLLLVIATVIAPAADDITLALMTADDIGVGIAVVVAEPQVCLLQSLQP
jgi:adenine/guanine phosphoribosyltransferase-like PRPP-binding protein